MLLPNLRQISIFNKIFNVNEGEWGRIALVWLIRLLYRIGFVIGWTVIVGMFVGRFGISQLPYLFGLNAIFILIGTFLYSLVLGSVKREYLMSGTLFLCSTILLAIYLFFQGSEILLFSLLLVCISTFLFQFNVVLGGFVEDLFTSLESERTFPLIESAETVGGIIAGLVIVLLAGSVETLSFLFLWIALLLLIVPLLVLAKHVSVKLPTLSRQILKSEAEEQFEFNSWSNLLAKFRSIRGIGFVRGLFVIVFIQWLLFNLLDFQYMTALYQNVSSVVLNAGSGFEHAFVHDLGELFILFSFSALLVQLLIGSRLINSLGVVGSMLVHPILTVLSVIGLMFSFNFYTAVLARNNFTITSVLHTNAYHSSYYVVNEKLREFTREFLEGVVRPIGALLGTLFILMLQHFFNGDSLIFAINVTLLTFAFVLLFYVNRQQKVYTDSAIYGLVKDKDKSVRFNSMDLLSQRGHSGSGIEVLGRVAINSNEPISVRIRALRAFAELKDVDALQYIIECFKAKNSVVRIGALDALWAYKKISDYKGEHLFLECELINALKALYKNADSDEVRSKVIRLLSRISSVATVDFLLDVIELEKGTLKADAIYTLGNYSDEAVVDFIRPYLDSADLDEKIAAIIALGRFKKHFKESVSYISALVKSGSRKKLEAAMYAIGELGIHSFKKVCVKHLYNSPVNLRMASAIAMAKMGFDDSIPVLVDLLFAADKKVSFKVKTLLKNVDVRIFKNVDKIVKQIVSEQLSELMVTSSLKSVSKLPKRKLRTLSWLYYLIEEYDEMENVKNLL